MIYTQKSDDLLLEKEQYCFVAACIGIRLAMNIFLQNLHQKLAGWLKWKDKNFSSMTIGKAYYIDDQTKYILIQQGCVAQIGKTHRHTNKYTDRQTDMANAVTQVEENNSILFRKQFLV